MTALALDLQSARAFIAALTGSEDAWCCWQTFSDRKVDKETRDRLGTHRSAPFMAVASWLVQQNDAGAGVYVTVNLTDGRGREIKNVTALRALFVDSDGTPMPATWALPPSILVMRDATHWHAYWLLVDGQELARFTRAQVQLAYALDTDRSIKDLTRVMRVPGFLHRKAEPCAVNLVSVDRSRLFTIDEVLAAYPLPAGVVIDEHGREVKQPKTPAPRPIRSAAEVDADRSLSDAAWMIERTREWAARVETTEGLANPHGGRDNAAFYIACECHARQLDQVAAAGIVAEYFARAGGGDDADVTRVVGSAYSKPRTPAREIPTRRSRRKADSSQPPVDEPPDDGGSGGGGGGDGKNPWGLDLDRLAQSWKISSRGVWPIEYSQRHNAYEERPNKRVADLPIWPEQQGVDVASGATFWRLAWWTPHGETKRAWMAEAEMKSGIALVALEDAPVAKRSCETCAVWLTAARVAVTASATRVTTRLGWCGRGAERTWVWPDAAAAADVAVTYIGGDLEAGGDVAAWRKGLDHLLSLADDEGYTALVVLGFAVGAAFSRVAGARNPVLGLSQRSSRGKGSALNYALSAWCAPDLLTVPASSSSKGIQDLAAGVPDCPILLEDLQQLAEKDPTQAADALYYLANGQRRVTSSKNQSAVGGERRYGCGFYAAENPVLTGRNEGVNYRVIELTGDPCPDEDTAKRLQRATAAHGAMATLLSAYLRSRPIAQWKTELQERAAAIRASRGGQSDLRGDDPEQLALLRLGLEAIATVLVAPVPCDLVTDWLTGRLADQRRNTRDRDTEVLFRIFDLVMGWRWGGDWHDEKQPEDGSRPRRTLEGVLYECERAGDRDGHLGWRLLYAGPAPELAGRLSRLELNTAADAIARVLRDYGGEMRVLTAWARRGWIERDGRHLKPKKYAAGRVLGRVVRFTDQALSLYSAEPAPPPDPVPCPPDAPPRTPPTHSAPHSSPHTQVLEERHVS